MTRPQLVPAGAARSAAAPVAAIAIGLLIVGTIASTVYFLYQRAVTPFGQQLATYRIGDCVTLSTATAGDPDIAKADCDADPSYTVGSVVQADATCPGPTYIRYVWTSADTTVGALCLAENLTVGNCYQHEPSGIALEIVDCASASSRGGEVVERIDNVIDVTRCPLNTTAYAFPVPARTYCLTSPRSTQPM